jgi:HEAT repeat protein
MRRGGLAFVSALALCLGAAETAQSAQSLAEAAQQLEARDARDRRRAAQDLGRIGSLQAFALLMTKGLEDRDPMVADEAQLQLAGVSSPNVAALAFGRHVLGHRDALVRLRIAEALGRMSAPIDAAQWAEALKENDPRAARTFVESLELHAAADRVTGKLEPLVKSLTRIARRDPDVSTRGAALLALARLDPGVARELADELGAAKEPTLRAASFEAWMLLDPEAASTHAAAVLDDEHAPLRARAVQALVDDGSRAAVSELVGRLEREERVRVRTAIVEGLRGLSGLRHGFDVRPWREWVGALPDDFEPPGASRRDAGGAGAANDDEGGRSTTLLGHAVRSDRVTFLIDMSGSMWTEQAGATRKQRVEVELRKALEALPRTARFNVVPYADQPAPFEKALVDASPANVARALTSFERSTLRGKGDVWGALMLALMDAEVDTVVVLTDGAPSGGERWNVELMRHLHARENRLRNVAVDAVLFGAPKALVQRWRELTEASGGRVTVVEL